MMPMENNGAAVIYHNFIRPFIKKHEKTIEKAINMTSDLAKDAGREGKSLKTIVNFYCYFIDVALSAVKDVAGNISVKNIQDLQEGVGKLHDRFASDDKPEDEEDKKEL